MTNTKSTLFDDQKKWLGPFLCMPSSQSMSVWMAFGPQLEENKSVLVRAKIFTEDTWVKANLKNSDLSPYGVQIHQFENLKPNTRYQYEVYVDGKAWLGESLTELDFVFRTLPASQDDVEIVLMSCHGIEAYENDPKTNAAEAWEMWIRLNQLLSSGAEKCYIGILGGDQVYMDDTFQADLSGFDPKNPSGMKKLIFETYLKYWGTPEYRKVMVKLPCCLMWDDHDIIDGWGSRTEQFKETFGHKIIEFVFQRVLRLKFITAASLNYSEGRIIQSISLKDR